MKLTDQRGEVIATYTYGTYGELLRGNTTLTRFLYNGRCGVETDGNGLYYMRQRYYSPEMKRFLNQDVVRGSLTASQSLNRYSYVQGNPVSYTDPFGLSPLNGLFTGTNFWHAVLGFIGCVPGPVGMVANLADAAVYALIDHDYGMAALAMLDCVSGGLSTLAKAASAAGKATKSARYLKTAGSLISNVSSFAQNASAGMATAFDMYEKYMIKGEEFDSSTPWEVASLGLSIVGMGISGRGMAGDIKALSKMLNEDMVSSRMRNAVMAFAADNRGCVGGKGSTCSGRVWDYSGQFDGELANFNTGYEIKNVVDKDLYLVQFHSAAEVGKGRSLKYWTIFDEANGISTVDDYMDKMALMSNWGARDNVSIAKVAAGTKVKYAIGTAKAQVGAIESRPGGGLQILFEQFDDSWVLNTRPLP